MDNIYKNRREFLKEMSLFAGASAFMASVPWMNAFAQTNPSNLAASNRVRIGMVGVGSRGRALLLNLQEIENTEIVAVCDNYEPNYQRAIELTGGKAKAFYDYREMIDMKDLDAIVIATPLHQHAHITVDFLNAGFHVFCEKSLARTLEDCKRMVDVQSETGKILQIGHQRLFNPVYLNALERIKAGEIGTIVQVRAFWHRNSDWRRKVPSPELERQINWRLYKESSAGLMTELAAHHIQVANWFLDRIPTRVMGSGSICYWKDGREVYDHVAAIYDYDDGIKCIYDSVTANKHYGLELQIQGDKGTLELEANRIYSENPPTAPGIRQLIHNIEQGIFETIPIGGASWVPETAVTYKGESLAPYDDNDTYLELVGFVEAVRNGKPYKNLLREGYHASIAALLGLQAMDTNQIVEWPAEYIMEKEV
ncbi:Gfo/Idh/MocA family protein [Bacteroidota bacterium]